MATNVAVEFELEKETKNTFRYQEVGDNPKVGQLYIKKSTAKELNNPRKLIVTITVKE